MFDEATADFTYARLQNGEDDEPPGYPPAALDGWADAAALGRGQPRRLRLFY